MNLQVIAGPGGEILWVSGALPGSVHDEKAEWTWGIFAGLEAAGLVVLGRQGLPGIAIREGPVQGEEQAESRKAANRAHAALRAPGERANARLKNWHILRKLRCCPWRAGQLAKAIHALQMRAA
jgi:DDE superfamily endonuclease